jgi:ornithine cyclodeaminase/alanine dehydrogenase-like protein (mu-crystallin family)
VIDINLYDLAGKIKQVFLEQDKYVFGKYVAEFQKDGKFGGDFVYFAMIDPSTAPATFYEVTSPFDLVSGKAPQLALVFRDGKCILNTDYTDYAAMRTGIMDGVVLAQTQKNKRINVLLFGSGKTASWSIRGLAELTPWIKRVDYYSKSGKKKSFESLGKEVGIELVFTEGWREQLSNYDVIICHTNASEPILSAQDMARVKKGAQIHSFIGSTEHGELADELYQGAEVVSDWPKILEDNKIMQRATTTGGVESGKIVYLKEFFGNNYQLKADVPYTIFQFGGTPLQNLAVLQLLTR